MPLRTRQDLRHRVDPVRVRRLVPIVTSVGRLVPADSGPFSRPDLGEHALELRRPGILHRAFLAAARCNARSRGIRVPGSLWAQPTAVTGSSCHPAGGVRAEGE